MKSLWLKMATVMIVSFLIFNLVLFLKFRAIISMIPDSGVLLGPGGPFLPRPLILGFAVPSNSYILQYDLLHALFIMFQNEMIIIPFAISLFLILIVSLARTSPMGKKPETSRRQVITVLLEKRKR
jgi:hypothetical protein